MSISHYNNMGNRHKRSKPAKLIIQQNRIYELTQWYYEALWLDNEESRINVINILIDDYVRNFLNDFYYEAGYIAFNILEKNFDKFNR